jgi:hypothetical protein
MRIGLNSLIGDGFGTGSFSFGEVPSGGESFPPYGEFYETLVGVTYPIAEGGESFVHPVEGTDVPNQVCDVDVYHDGTGGFYNDWANATNVAYQPAGTIFWVDNSGIITANPAEVPAESGNYYDAYWGYINYAHDGTGGYVYDDVADTPWADGVEVSESLRSYSTVEVPSGSETYYENGKYATYVWDGALGTYLSTGFGSFFANGTLIVDVYQTVEVPDGSGNSYSNGKYTRYNWNGSGGYTTLTNQGSFYANNTTIYTENIQTEVPSGTLNYYQTGETTIYKWNGSGGFTGTQGEEAYPYGTYITDDGTIAYYWDGSGGYYEEYL